jgi:fumarate reductase flavoprotein subunit
VTEKTINADLVVIGAGASGLAAAVRAREAGVKDVVVLEKTSHPGGNAWVAVVMLGLGERNEPEDDMTAWRDQTFLRLMEFSMWKRDPGIIRAYVDTYPDVVRWLMDKGMRFGVNGFDLGEGRRFTVLCMNERQGNYKVTEPSRGPGFIGSTATDLLLRECLDSGVRIMTKTRATKIVLGEASEQVRGVVATGPEGEITVAARAVVLAAGGFGANKEMMREYFPEHYRDDGPVETLCLGSSTGDGLVMAKELGLVMCEDMDSGIMGPSHHPWSHSIHETVHRPETLWVNRSGQRFINESVSIMGGEAIGRQPGGYLWALFDSSLKDYMIANPSARQIAMSGRDWLRTLSEDLDKEAGWKRKTVAIADSWEALAQKLEIDPHVLAGTVERYNELCDQGRDADFVKQPEFLKALRTPPYYAALGVRFCHGTSGGARVNGRMEVTGRHGRRIEGLWATGDNSGGWVTHIGLPGTTLGFAFTSGYIAGEQVAARLRP